MRRHTAVGSEQEMTFMLARYMQLKHADCIWHFDYGSGARLTMGQAIAQKRLNPRAWPDLFIAKKSKGKHGLFLELKRAGTKITKQDGEFVADKHIREQAAIIKRLRQEGYDAYFAIGYDHAVGLIEAYFGV